MKRSMKFGAVCLAVAGVLGSAAAFGQIPMLPDEQAAHLARIRGVAMGMPMLARQTDSQILRTSPGTRNCSMTIGVQQPVADARRLAMGPRENTVYLEGSPTLICQ